MCGFLRLMELLKSLRKKFEFDIDIDIEFMNDILLILINYKINDN